MPYRYDPGDLAPQEVEIAVTHCGICHSDLHLISNDWGISQYPFIPGHEVVGTVTAVGSEVKSLQAGQRVGLGWQSNSCGVCEWCTRGMENLCPDSEATCVHRNGGYADSVRANARFVIPIPEALSSEHAAPLLCGGITVYNPLRTHGVNPSSRVGVVGIGGLGHMGIKIAHAMGARVVAFTTSESKRAAAKQLGADEVVVSRHAEEMAAHAKSFDLILDTVAAPHDLDALLVLLRRDGTLVLVGAPATPHPSPQVFDLITRRRSLAGSMIGGIPETQEMLDFCAEHGIVADIELIRADQINASYERMLRGDVKYRFVIDNATLSAA